MKPFYYITAVLTMVGLVPALWLGATLVSTYQTLPFVAFVLPLVVDLVVMAWAMHKLEE